MASAVGVYFHHIGYHANDARFCPNFPSVITNGGFRLSRTSIRQMIWNITDPFVFSRLGRQPWNRKIQKALHLQTFQKGEIRFSKKIRKADFVQLAAQNTIDNNSTCHRYVLTTILSQSSAPSAPISQLSALYRSTTMLSFNTNDKDFLSIRAFTHAQSYR